MPDFMVRIMRSSDDDFADVAVTAETEDEAASLALSIVRHDPSQWFDVPAQPIYFIDRSSEIEDVTGGEYAPFAIKRTQP